MNPRKKKRPAKTRPDKSRVVARIKATKGQPVRVAGKLVEVSRSVTLVVVEEAS